MVGKWISTKFKGVRYYEHLTRKHGVKFDRYLAIRYQKDGRRIEEGIGWTSERDPDDSEFWTEAKAALVLERLRGAAKHGKKEAPTRITEKRAIEKQRKEAEKAAQELAEKENVTFGQYWENTYFPTYKIGRKESTTRKGQEHFKNWIEPVIGKTPLKDIKPFAIEKIKKNILGADKAPRTLQYVLATIRQAWNTARLNGLVIGDSPTKQIKIPKVDNKRVRFLSYEEAETLLSALKEADALTHDLALLSLNCGLRFGEIAALKWGHIDIDRGMIEIVDPKGGQGRQAFMTGKVKTMFDKMKSRKIDDYIFIQNGEKLNDPPRVFHDVVDEIGLNNGVNDPRRKVVFHSLRHTFASWHVTAGTDIYAVKSLLGHSNISMTERYSHLAPETLQNATRTLEKAINKARHKKDQGQVVNFKK
ncbi:MAG: tyrosine-type recombinase/integrase [Smithella sp.]